MAVRFQHAKWIQIHIIFQLYKPFNVCMGTSHLPAHNSSYKVIADELQFGDPKLAECMTSLTTRKQFQTNYHPCDTSASVQVL